MNWSARPYSSWRNRRGRRGERGDVTAAAGYWEQVLKAEPAHAEAANALGMLHLSQGRAAEAVRLLAIADAADPGQPALLFNLAAAKRVAGDTLGAIEALKKALEADPYFVQAMFQSGVLLEELGQLQAAAFHFKNVLDTAPPEVAEDPRFAPMLARAREAVAKSNSALDQQIEQATAGSPALPERAREAVAILTGKQRNYTVRTDLLHRPALARAAVLRPRAHAVDRGARGGHRSHPGGSGARGWRRTPPTRRASCPMSPTRPTCPATSGRSSITRRNGARSSSTSMARRTSENRARCPRTTELLERMPLLRLAGRGPNAMFSLLQPGTRIPPHTGVTNIRSTVHLPLIVPPGCGFRVGAETREWKPGTAWVFDDTIEHEAWNDSDKLRLILIFDIWNPLLSADEQRYYADVLAAYDRHMGRVPRESDIF